MHIEFKIILEQAGIKKVQGEFYPIFKIEKETDFDELHQIITKGKEEFLLLSKFIQ